MNELQQATAYINASKTGCIAKQMGNYIEVQVPGIQSMPGGKNLRVYSIELVLSMSGAQRLLNSMV